MTLLNLITIIVVLGQSLDFLKSKEKVLKNYISIIKRV